LHIIRTTALIVTKFCTTTKTTRYRLWVIYTPITNPGWRTAAVL